MPCTHCGGTGHNRRTCPLAVAALNMMHPQAQPPDNDPPPRNNDIVLEQVNEENNPEPIIQESIIQRWVEDNVGGPNVDIHQDIINNDAENPIINDHNENNINIIEENINHKYDLSIHNMKDENFIIYLVSGNSLIWNLDTTENDLHYLGIVVPKSSFDMKRCVGARVLVIPYGESIQNPEFHPPTDKKLWTKPYCTIDIKEEHKTCQDIYIDDGNQLSELNKWKFNALKLDFLLKEVIKLGGKNYDNLEPILDLHQDIELGNHDDFEKDRSGIPSSLTNIT